MPQIRIGEREIAYDDPWADDARRLPVLCLHGSSFGRATWQPCLPHLGASGTYRPITFDQPGHGGSSGPVADSVAALGATVVAFVDALGLARPFALVGHSLGGAVAQWYLATRPDDVVAIGLVSTTPRFTVPAETLAAWKADGLDYPDARLAAIVSPVADRRARDAVLAARAETTLAALHGDLDAIAGWDNPAWLDLARPALVVTADADTPSVQDYARTWAAGLARGTLAVIPRAGHMMPIEQPAATARAIVDWLDAVLADPDVPQTDPRSRSDPRSDPRS